MHGITVNVDHKVKGHDVWCWWVTTKNNMCFNQFQIYDNIAEKGCAGGLNMVGFFTTLKRWPESNIIYGSTVRTCNAIKNFNSTFCILDPPSFDLGGSKIKGQFLSYMLWQLWHPICHCFSEILGSKIDDYSPKISPPLHPCIAFMFVKKITRNFDWHIFNEWYQSFSCTSFFHGSGGITWFKK